ncbi:LexA repressor [Andreesenia angusta]|uniref:LexA repressor n=1 Tax=Andreesenia angusta TaxID=39480 RepID=A0A1S1V8C4_9FIRM|nr:transcriptional repressor LexA [Andreesenia angusta]OHW62853.1 LexA repressor [Andreesenia angusta]
MYDDLSAKQSAILEFIKSEISKKGYPPSVREICVAVGLKSTSTVHSHLEKLEGLGYIKRDASKPRTIEVMDSGNEGFVYKKETIDIPVLGRVAAGEPLLATENIEDVFPMPVDFVPKGESFMLKVKGDSMINAGIYDKDFILVKHQSSAESGDIVVALLGSEATVKRFFKEKDHIRLQPENDYMAPILAKEVTIVGKVVGLFRKI